MGTRFSSRWLCILAATLALPIPLVAAQGDAGDAVADDAQADDAAPGDAEAGGRDAEARDLFNAGRRAFSDGRFAEALERFEASYELSGRPALLYNIGTTQDRLRRSADAVRNFRLYLDAMPDAENAAEVRARVALLEGEVAARPAEEPMAPVPEPSHLLRNLALVTAGVAVVAGGIGLGLYIDVRHVHSDLEMTCAPDCAQPTIDASGGPRRQRAARAMVGIAVAAAASSVLLFVLAPRGRSSEEGGGVEVRAALGGLQVRGEFR